MLLMSNEEILSQTEMFEAVYKDSAMAPLYFDKFMSKSFSNLYKGIESQYPKEIRIPKSLNELLEGDSEPSRIIRLEKPFYYKETPIWGGDSTKGIFLRGLGYRNGDSRYPSTQKLDNNDIHAILGGATGQGKSVTVNAVINGITFEYAPWEVKLIMVDAKVAEFKKYALGHVMPHIISVAATTDADYMISVLEDIKREMERVNSMFSVYGQTDIEGFRKKTGLVFPRNVIPFDEFQTAFANAGKKASTISDLIDSFARLGRSTGYHLLLSSQEPGGIPANTLGNIKVRAALGCLPDISQKLLGNDEAKVNFGVKGRVIINSNPANGIKSENVHYRVPFQTPEMFEDQMEFLSDLGDEVGFRYNLSFYDEDAKTREKDFVKFLNTKKISQDKIYLGEPSFVMRDKDGDNTVRLQFSGDDIENIMVYCSSSEKIERYLKMLYYNISLMGSSVVNNVISPDKPLVERVGFKNITNNIYDVRSSTDGNFTGFFVSVYRRLLALEADQMVFTRMLKTDESDKIFYDVFSRGSEYDSEFNRARMYAILGLLQDKTYRDGFSLPEFNGKVSEQELNIVQDCIAQAHVSGCAKEMLTYSKLSPIFNWVIGVDRIIGIGRDMKSNQIEKFKKVLQDCTRANVRYILSGTNAEDLGGIKTGVRYLLMEGLTEAQARRMGCEDYPASIAPVLGILHDKYGSNKDCLKFKKMIFDDETVS
jgi:hypothetical protein